MKKALVGYTGFVGSNIYESGVFDAVYNSKNIEQAYGTHPDLLIYAGLRAEKYLANQAPDKDMELIEEAMENICKIAPKRLVLISTVDVWKNPNGKTEEDEVDTTGLHAYGYNRYCLEQWVREKYPDAVIVRLPGLFGSNIKKNFIYDYINIIPFMLKADKFEELSVKAVEFGIDLRQYYEQQENGFYRCKTLEREKKAVLRRIFEKLDFTALNFTDSRNVYQFYPLYRLWDDIQILLMNNIRLWHPATEPVSAQEIYRYLAGRNFENVLNTLPVCYDFKTKYAEAFEGKNGYICTKTEILEQIKFFVESEKSKL